MIKLALLFLITGGALVVAVTLIVGVACQLDGMENAESSNDVAARRNSPALC